MAMNSACLVPLSERLVSLHPKAKMVWVGSCTKTQATGVSPFTKARYATNVAMAMYWK